MNEKLFLYLKEFVRDLQANLNNFQPLEELLLNLEEEGIEAQLEIELSIKGKLKGQQISPVRTKIIYKNSIEENPQFILTIEDLEFLRSLGIEPLKKEKSIKK